MRIISIEVGEIKISAELNESETADIIYNNLPLSGNTNIWGDEIYFNIPFHIDQSADAVQDVELGGLGYWPAGDAFCIFFGPTPVSINELPRAYSPVNLFGKVKGDSRILKQVNNGQTIKVSKEA
jgi:uncharacterized protein